MSVNYSGQLPNAANPSLLPNFNSFSQPGNVTVSSTNEQFLAANPRTAATNAVTVGGTVTTGDVLTLTLTNPSLLNGSVSVSYTAVNGDTLTTIAAHLAAAICNSPVCLFRQIFGTSLGPVVTVNQMGPVGNSTVVTGSVTALGTETLTPAASGVMSGGAGPVIPFHSFNSNLGNVTLVLRENHAVSLNTSTVAALVACGSPII